jgi:hypothetical protein
MTFTFLELLDRTFRIYRENFLTLIGLAALVTIPLTVIDLIVSLPVLGSTTNFSTFGQRGMSPELTSALCMFYLVSGVIGLLQFVLINAPITYIASENQLGRRVSIGQAFSATRSRFSNVTFGIILLGVVIFAFAIAVALVGVICPPVFATIGVVVYIYLSTYAFLAPVLVLEDVGTSFGINRAWSLGKARFWMIVGVWAALTVISLVITVAFTAAAEWIILQVLPRTVSLTTTQVINTVLTTIVGLFIVPLLPIALTLLYYDTRTRYEGLDIALQALGRPDARPRDVASPPGGAGLNSKDWVNIAILTVGSLVIGLLAGAAVMSLINTFMPMGGGF